MKFIFITTLIFLLQNTDLKCQEKDPVCPFLKSAPFNVYIPGYSDTLQDNDIKARVIDVTTLVNGFELVADDSLVKIKSFYIVYDDNDGNLNSKPSNNNKILKTDTKIPPLYKIREAGVVTVENIRIEYKGNCYSILSQVYYHKKI